MNSNKDNQRVEVQVQQIARNIYRICEKESSLKTTILHLNDIEGRTAQYTGLPRSLVSNLRKDPTHLESKHQPFDVFERILVLNALFKFYYRNHIRKLLKSSHGFPQFSDIYDEVKQDLVQTQSFARFCCQMKQMGFDYRKTTTGYILAEDMRLTFERFHYLKKLRRCKSLDTKIYYIDERIIDKTFTFPKPDFRNENSTTLQDGCIFYHVFSDTALENYFFTNKICKITYMKWVESLLTILEPGSLIVIDNGKLNETVTPYHTKAEMVKWLIKNNVPHSIQMPKAELYELIIRSGKHNNTECIFDQLFKAHNFDVLRLPFQCLDLSPLSLLWKEMPQKMVTVTDTFTPFDFDKILPGLIAETHSLSWKENSKQIVDWEDQFFDIDSKIEPVLDTICKFDIAHVTNVQLPEYFYELDV